MKKLRGMRIGQVGVRPASFWSVKTNEAELLERFGIEVIPITEQDIRQGMERLMRDRAGEVAAEADSIRAMVDRISVSAEALQRTAAMKLALHE